MGSTGTDFSKREPLTWMVLLSSTSARFLRTLLSSMIFRLLIRLESQCSTPPCSTYLVFNSIHSFWYHSHLSTQYCDGLRGVIVIYGTMSDTIWYFWCQPKDLDPNDPLKQLYDVDDESTIITLSDWYHVLAPEGTNDFFQSGIVP